MDALVNGERLAFGNFRLEPRGGQLFRRDATGAWASVPIGSRALEVLRVLISHPGAVVSKDSIMDAVWPGIAVEPNNLTVQIAALRRVLDEGCSGGSCIQTVPGQGYRLLFGVTQAAAVEAIPPAAAVVGWTQPVPEADTRRGRPIQRPGALMAAGVMVIALLLVAGWHRGWFSRTHEPPPLSLVVLPFEGVGGHGTDTYLAGGITEGLTTALSHIPGALVISRATADTYRGKAEDIRKIGQDLGVRYAVRGSVQQFGQVLRVNSELGSTDSGVQLWSDSFDQQIADLAAGQEAIVTHMRSSLNISLADIEAARSLRERPTNPGAFDLILRARATALLPPTMDTVTQTLGLYEQALERDPNAVLALTGAVNAVLGLIGYGALPPHVALDRASQYLARAHALEPNSESVLMAQARLLDWQQDGLDYRHVRADLKAAAKKLIDLYPSNPNGYFELGVAARNEGQYDEAAGYFAKAIRLNPRAPYIRNFYWNMAVCNILAGHDREGLGWADRTMTAPGDLQSFRVRFLLFARIVAYYRIAEVETAKRLVAEANERYPLALWRGVAPADPDSEIQRKQVRSFQDAVKAAGLPDHNVDPDADFGVPPDGALHKEFEGKTPTAAAGVTTVNTEQLAAMLEHDKPLVIDTMEASWYRSVPGAVGLDFHGQSPGTFSDQTQKRLERKLRELTGGDTARLIVAVGLSVVHFDGYNLALRIRYAGYTNVYWYRGGREAWEVAGKPEDEMRPAYW